MLLFLLLFSCQVLSNSLGPYRLQDARPLCPSPSPRVCPNSGPLNRWCHPTISSSVAPFSSCPQSCISHIYTCIPSFLSLPPPSHHPVSLGHHRALSRVPCTKQLLPTILYMVVYISIPLSQFFPPSPSSSVYQQVCSLCLCLSSCSANRFIISFFWISCICIN